MITLNFENQWSRIQELAESEQIDQIQELAAAGEDRVALLRFAIRSLMSRPWNGKKNLDVIIQLSDAAVDEALRAGLKDQANVVCYNSSANLAPCWEDGFVREKRHFEKGLEYANRAIQFRIELKKGPGPFFMAHWARGIHLLFLGRTDEAQAAFRESLEFAIQRAGSEGQRTDVHAESPFDVLLARGYLALSESKAEELAQVLNAFEGMKARSAEAREDAEIGISQLNRSRKLLGS